MRSWVARLLAGLAACCVAASAVGALPGSRPTTMAPAVVAFVVPMGSGAAATVPPASSSFSTGDGSAPTGSPAPSASVASSLGSAVPDVVAPAAPTATLTQDPSAGATPTTAPSATTPAVAPTPHPPPATPAATPAATTPTVIQVRDRPLGTPAATTPAAPSGPLPVLSHGDRNTRVIALTIDDCYSPAAVRADLAILEAERVNPTWFPIGTNVAASPALWRAIAQAGFPIANHTETHPILTGLPYAAVLAQIRDDEATVARITGRPAVPFLRPPGGAYDATVLAAAQAAGERALVLWDTTDGDTGRPYDDIVLIERHAEQGHGGSILLMHANLPYAQQALPSIIAWYRARGYTFVTLGQLFGVPGPVPFPGPAGAPLATAAPIGAVTPAAPAATYPSPTLRPMPC